MALESFAAIKAESKAVILGDMLELGEKSEDEHMKSSGICLNRMNIENILLVGNIFLQSIRQNPDSMHFRMSINSRNILKVNLLRERQSL